MSHARRLLALLSPYCFTTHLTAQEPAAERSRDTTRLPAVDIAVPSGWGGWMKGFAPELYGGNRGNTLIVFALP